jgi:hypothetical protein
MTTDLLNKAIARIPSQLRRDEFRFVPILSGEKRPFEQKWNVPGGANYRYDDPKLAGYLVTGYNWGTCTGMGDLIIFDSDAEVRLQEIGVAEKLPKTFAVRTGGGGLHRYYICHDSGSKIVMYDAEDGRHLGEVQTLGFQAVGPGSIHPNGSRYRVEVDAPIAEVAWAEIYDILEGRVEFGLAEDADEKPSIIRVSNPGAVDLFENVWIEDVWQPTGKVRRRDGVISGSHPIHGSTGGQNFQINTKKNTWFCYRCWVGGGPALAVAVKEGVINCSEAGKGVLRGDLFKEVVEIAKARGYIKPPLQTGERIK